MLRKMFVRVSCPGNISAASFNYSFRHHGSLPYINPPPLWRPLGIGYAAVFFKFYYYSFFFLFLSKALTFCARTHNFILHSSQSPFFLYFLLDKFQNRSGRQLNKYVVEPSAQSKLLFFLLSILFFLLNRARLL